MQAVYAKCISWIDAITPDGVTVYVRDQNAPPPASPRVALRIAAVREQAQYRDGIDDTDTQPVTRWISFTLALTIHAEGDLEAETIAGDIQDRLWFSEQRIEHTGRDVAFNAILNGPQTINATIGPRIEGRVSLDLAMSATRALAYEVGPIETVTFGGNVDGITPGATTPPLPAP